MQSTLPVPSGHRPLVLLGVDLSHGITRFSTLPSLQHPNPQIRLRQVVWFRGSWGRVIDSIHLSCWPTQPPSSSQSQAHSIAAYELKLFCAPCCVSCQAGPLGAILCLSLALRSSVITHVHKPNNGEGRVSSTEVESRVPESMAFFSVVLPTGHQAVPEASKPTCIYSGLHHG